jgi:radical SAM superfamily enzyme YgiQ (UPF0313 family)
VIVELARALKTALPGLWIVYGGVYPTYHAEEILSSHQAIDVIVRGEGEATAPQLLTAIESGVSLAFVPGIAYRESGVACVTRPATAIHDSVFPFPANEPSSHPGKRGGDGLSAPHPSGNEPASHPGKRGGDATGARQPMRNPCVIRSRPSRRGKRHRRGIC